MIQVTKAAKVNTCCGGLNTVCSDVLVSPNRMAIHRTTWNSTHHIPPVCYKEKITSKIYTSRPPMYHKRKYKTKRKKQRNQAITQQMTKRKNTDTIIFCGGKSHTDSKQSNICFFQPSGATYFEPWRNFLQNCIKYRICSGVQNVTIKIRNTFNSRR